METTHAEAIALHRWAVIAEATAAHLTPAERGAIVRAAAEKHHAHPDGTHGATRGTPSTAGSGNGGREGSKRSVLPPRTTGAVRAHPELFTPGVSRCQRPKSQNSSRSVNSLVSSWTTWADGGSGDRPWALRARQRIELLAARSPNTCLSHPFCTLRNCGNRSAVPVGSSTELQAAPAARLHSS
jgi:hypothetical protein